VCSEDGFVTDALLMFEAVWSYTLIISYIKSQLFEIFMFVMFTLAEDADGIDVVYCFPFVDILCFDICN
jgi:hypothetical protein